MSTKDWPAAERAAMVVLRPDGKWEVQVSESEPSEGNRRWRHKKLFATEQEAEIFARSLLPYIDSSWNRNLSLNSDIPDTVPLVKRPEKSRRPKHHPEV